ncbi:response regulator [Marinospirillum minutulum]|uniref:response regulator n=1 Tax=Marinospirillum minutulum TaxID=64974 RepID=UPI00041DBCC4|nr:response regulator [Marinospirillum minutulum]
MKLLPETKVSEHPAQLLLVDDDLSLLKLLSLRLESAGHEVVTAESGPEALEILKQFTPDLVLSDLRMDEMDGLALFEEIQQSYPGLPVIILTAHGTIPDAVQATRCGVAGFLTKPVDKNQLFSLIDELKGTRPVDTSNKDYPDVLNRSPLLVQLMAKQLLNEAANRLESQANGFAPEALELLAKTPWPGSVRQLQGVIEQCAGLTNQPMITAELVNRILTDETTDLPHLSEARAEFEKAYLIKVLRLAEGKVTKAAELAGRNRTDFYKLLNKHGLEAARFKEEAKSVK